MKLYTIGFTKKSAQEFFGSLKRAGVKRVIDVRLRNESQLAGFAKKRDLEYFLNSCHGIAYIHDASLAPTQEMLTSYRKKRISWQEYEASFMDLLRTREVQYKIDRSTLEDACLMCTEPGPERCHRRLVVEYLARVIPDMEVVHL